MCDCVSEGPPGPIWCTWCGHAPSCCRCDDNDPAVREFERAVRSGRRSEVDEVLDLEG